MAGFEKISNILAKSNGNIFFECPACECPHGINCGEGHGEAWSFNGDLNKPTFLPSLLVSFTHGKERKSHVCHSFVVDGKIQYLNDCTHEFAGKTVDIPDWNVA